MPAQSKNGSAGIDTQTSLKKYPRERVRLCALLIAAAAASLSGSGCATLLGTVPGVEERASDYRFEDPVQASPDWRALPAQTPAPAPSTTLAPSADGSAAGDPHRKADRPDTSDFAWQSARTASIISLTTACGGATTGPTAPTLEDLSGQLLMGVTDVVSQESHDRQVAGFRALETTTEGSMSGEKIRLRSVVLRNGRCTYDLMLIGRPARFAADEPAFNRFVDSFRIR